MANQTTSDPTQIHNDDSPYTAWHRVVENGLKGKDFNESLVSKTEDGIIRGPIFSTSDLENRHLLSVKRTASRGETALPWQIYAPVIDPDINFANTQALRDLEGGANGLLLHLDPSGHAGVHIETLQNFKDLIDNVYVDLIQISLMAGPYNWHYAGLCLQIDRLQSTALNLGIDPITLQMSTRLEPPHTSVSTDLNDEFSKAAELLGHIKDRRKNWSLFGINAASLHNQGASAVQELAYMASSLSFYMQFMSELGLSPTEAAAQIKIYLASTQDAHLSLVKFRAARLIYRRIMHAYGASEAKQGQFHALTSNAMMQKIAPWNNLLRLNSAIFGAVCGGADALTAAPFSAPLGLPDQSAYRMSRNMQLMMMEESHLAHVDDPAHGSYSHESLTHDYAQIAWKLFQTIEDHGGITEPKAQKALLSAILLTRSEREDRDEACIGVNLHPAPDLRTVDMRKPPVLTPSKAQPIRATHLQELEAQIKAGHRIPPLTDRAEV